MRAAAKPNLAGLSCPSLPGTRQTHPPFSKNVFFKILLVRIENIFAQLYLPNPTYLVFIVPGCQVHDTCQARTDMSFLSPNFTQLFKFKFFAVICKFQRHATTFLSRFIEFLPDMK